MAELLNHAIHRLMERTEQEVSRKEITRAIENRQMVFAKKLSTTRSLVYVTTPSGIIKLVLHKPSGKVITILPWKGEYTTHLEWDSKQYNGRIVADLFPDCYLETDCRSALTKIFKIHSDGAKEPIAFNHPYFDGIFKEAMALYNAFKQTKEVPIEAPIETEVGGTCSDSCTLSELSGQGAERIASAR